MLGKLLKYEVKSTARIFLPLYASLLIFAVINNIFIRINGENNKLVISIISGISIAAYVFIIIAIFVFTLFVMIQRFYKNLLGDEGYLMFTLPVKTGENIITKLLASMMWVIISVIVTLLSIIIISYNDNIFISILNDLSKISLEINNVFGISGYLFFAEAFIAIIMTLATSILMVYASIATGQMLNRHKLLGAFGAYLAFNMIMQIIVSIIVVIASAIELNTVILMEYKNTIPHLIIIGIIFFNLTFTAIYYIITNLILSRRLNLE